MRLLSLFHLKEMEAQEVKNPHSCESFFLPLHFCREGASGIWDECPYKRGIHSDAQLSQVSGQPSRNHGMLHITGKAQPLTSRPCSPTRMPANASPLPAPSPVLLLVQELEDSIRLPCPFYSSPCSSSSSSRSPQSF